MDVLSFMTSLLLLTGGAALGWAVGTLKERQKWSDLQKMAVAGQRLWVRGIGEVFVFGYSEDDSFVDIIPEAFLDGKWPSEVDPEIIEKNIIAIPTKQFLAHVVQDKDTYLKSAR